MRSRHNASHALERCMRGIHFLALLIFIAPGAAFALPDELEVHLDDINKPGQWGVDVISNYTVSGPRVPTSDGLRPTRHLLQVSPDFSYGLTKTLQFDLQLFSSLGVNGETRFDGGRVELLTMPIKSKDDDDDGPFFGGLFEVGHLPRTLSTNRLDAEVKIFLGYRLGKWVFAANPEIGFKVSGEGSGAQPDLSLKTKIAYCVQPGVSVGLEHYGELGQLQRIGPLNQQSQQTFAVVDFKTKGKDFNVGIGRGWNDFSERWVLKTIVSFPFGSP